MPRRPGQSHATSKFSELLQLADGIWEKEMSHFKVNYEVIVMEF